MPGIGAAPKDASRRRRTNPAARGEWIDMPSVAGKPPALPKGLWSSRTKAAWISWWKDPASSQWTPADRGAVVELAYLHADLVMGRVSLAAEVRLRMDLLGLSQKGKRDLRWRIAQVEASTPLASVTAINRYQAMIDG